MNENNNTKQRVILTPEEIAMSERNKKRKQTTSQLPVVRDICNLLYQLVIIVKDCPRKLTKYTDCMLTNTNEVLASVNYANEVHGEERSQSLTNCIAVMRTVRAEFIILHKIRAISKDCLNLCQKAIDRILAQLVAWRSYNQEGCQSCVQ